MTSPAAAAALPETPPATWEMAVGRPDPRLAQYVREYQGYAFNGESTQVEVPFGRVPLILGFGSSLSIEHPTIRGGASMLRTFAAGMHDTYCVTKSSGLSQGVQVNMTPIGAHLFLGVPMDVLTNRAVELSDLFGTEGALLAERLHDASDWAARFALVDAFILQRMARAKAASPAVAWAWRQIEHSAGNVSVASLAESVGWSRKHLASQFRAQVGLPPKTVARIVRFARARTMLERSDGRRWIDIALRCGYYDQAHLIRDFNDFTGASPGDFLARRLPEGGYTA